VALLFAISHLRAAEGEDKLDYTTESLRGRIVFMADALERLHGVKTVAESRARTLVLETPAGELHPIIEDKRGHAFRLDERLMAKPMELFVRRHKGSPAVQVIRVHTIENGERYLLDYWCDICAIPMFELKPCDCCQGPIRFRKRKLDKDGEPLPETGPPSEN
jgi:hypothetical protein